MGKKLSNEVVDFMLIDKNLPVERISEYQNSTTKILWKCKKCYNEWHSTPHNILNGYGCPICGGSQKLTNEKIDQRISDIGLNIKRVGDYINTETKILFQCLICNENWFSRPKITNKCIGCPKCRRNNRMIWSNEKIDQFLIENNIEIIRLSNITTSKETMTFKCKKCENIWDTRANWIIAEGKRRTGCPKCNLHMWSNEKIDERLLLDKRNIIRLSNYNGNNKNKMQFRCQLCDNIWQTGLQNIINQGQGCPCCKSSKSENIIRLYFNEHNISYHPQYAVKLPCNKKFSLIDFYVPQCNLFIEYNGIQHFRPETFGAMSIDKAQRQFDRQLIRDGQLREYCKNNNIKLLEIDGRKYFKKTLINLLKEIILPSIINNQDILII